MVACYSILLIAFDCGPLQHYNEVGSGPWHLKQWQLECLFNSLCRLKTNKTKLCITNPVWDDFPGKVPDSKVHEANMGPTWFLSAPDGPHVVPMNLAIRGVSMSWHQVYNIRRIQLPIWDILAQPSRFIRIQSIYNSWYFSHVLDSSQQFVQLSCHPCPLATYTFMAC